MRFFKRLVILDFIWSVIGHLWWVLGLAGALIGIIWSGVSSWSEGLTATQTVVLELFAAFAIGLLVAVPVWISVKVGQWIHRKDLGNFSIRRWSARDSGEGPRLQRDAWLIEGIYYIASGEWAVRNELPEIEPEITAIYSAASKVRQAARDGVLPIWGRESLSEPYEEILPEYWKFYRFDEFDLLRGNSEEFKSALARRVRSISHGPHISLKTNRSKVEELRRTEVMSVSKGAENRQQILKKIAELRERGVVLRNHLSSLRVRPESLCVQT